MPGWMWLIMGLLFAAALFVFLWGTGTIRVGRERGGTVDLSAAAARGELDLDWSDPRHAPPSQTRFDSDSRARQPSDKLDERRQRREIHDQEQAFARAAEARGFEMERRPDGLSATRRTQDS